MINATRLRQLLAPFGVDLSSAQTEQALAYLDLLLRWNAKINLTAIRDPEQCVTRHFGESLFIAAHLKLRGTLLDIGTGAGFPGLALKIAFPELSITLLEPVAKKRAFLKEAMRACDFHGVDVRGDRLEAFARNLPPPAFDFATSRAVGDLPWLLPLAAACLRPAGNLLLWLTQEQVASLDHPSVTPQATWEIPLTRSGVVWCGVKAPGASA